MNELECSASLGNWDCILHWYIMGTESDDQWITKVHRQVLDCLAILDNSD